MIAPKYRVHRLIMEMAAEKSLNMDRIKRSRSPAKKVLLAGRNEGLQQAIDILRAAIK